jgi:hypothetical protein
MNIEFLQFWIQNINQLNGRMRSAPIAPCCCQAVDTSESGYGATLLGTSWTFAQGFSREEKKRIQQGQFSSAERELYGYRAALIELIRSDPDQFRNTRAVQI